MEVAGSEGTVVLFGVLGDIVSTSPGPGVTGDIAPSVDPGDFNGNLNFLKIMLATWLRIIFRRLTDRVYRLLLVSDSLDESDPCPPVDSPALSSDYQKIHFLLPLPQLLPRGYPTKLSSRQSVYPMIHSWMNYRQSEVRPCSFVRLFRVKGIGGILRLFLE
jgi:hypothetical protein